MNELGVTDSRFTRRRATSHTPDENTPPKRDARFTVPAAKASSPDGEPKRDTRFNAARVKGQRIATPSTPVVSTDTGIPVSTPAVTAPVEEGTGKKRKSAPTQENQIPP